MPISALRDFYDRPVEAILADPKALSMHAVLLDSLETGILRAAELDGETWRPNTWVKQAILVGFRRTGVAPIEGFGPPAIDKTAYPPRRFTIEDGVRIVPGGTAVRRGAYLARGVVVMPPAYVNVGAYVDEGSMIDSHALVGSCAQVGKRVHLSAAAQLGGVLEPAGARPVIVEDDAFIGALAGVFEGVIVRKRAVIAGGVVLTGSSVIHDLVHGREYQREVPEGAVVVPGSRPAKGDYAKANGIQLATPCIVKYRDAKTDAATALEDALR